jgi:hypothetical protein
MRSLLCSSLWLAIASVAAAQTLGTPGSLPGPSVPPTSGQVQAPSYGLYSPTHAQTPNVDGQLLARPLATQINGFPAAQSANCCPATNCAAPAAASCCQPCPTCERVPATRDVRHVFYCKTCEPFCLPVCSCCICHWFGCGTCCCEGPYAKYYLIRKVQIEKCPTTKCVPTSAPACGDARLQPQR